MLEDWEAMFSDSRDIASNADVAACSFESAEAAGDLEAGFDHPEGALGFVVLRAPVPLVCRGFAPSETARSLG